MKMLVINGGKKLKYSLLGHKQVQIDGKENFEAKVTSDKNAHHMIYEQAKPCPGEIGDITAAKALLPLEVANQELQVN